jgi:hypothetical protein
VSTNLFNGLVVALGVALAACGGKIGDSSGDGGSTCTAPDQRCTGNTLQTCVDGTFEDQTECPNACDATLGCVACVPGTATCNGDTSSRCTSDGMGFVEEQCDPLLGVSCGASGLCEGACSAESIGQNYIGCEYYPTVTGNTVDNIYEFAVAISNTAGQAADVHIEGGGLTAPVTFAVQPNSVAVQPLPWVTELKVCNSTGQLECGQPQEPSTLAAGGAYHLRSTQPITVYQFNPLNYELNSNCTCTPTCRDCSFTNDASLLLPVNAMTPNYYVASYPAWPANGGNYPGLIAVTGTQDSTQVTISTTADTLAGTGVLAFSTGIPQAVTINAGDVVQLQAFNGDLTGSVVAADKPVQVIGAHFCTQVPNGTPACDHVEESMFPLETLGDRYIVTAPAVPALPNGKVEIVRIVATEANTSLTFDPPQTVAGTIANAGGFVEITATLESFEVVSDKKILVAQYMEGQAAGGGTGDPAMALAIPVEQYRTEYQFHAPANYETNYVNVTAPMSATVTLDGQVLTGFTAIGASGIGVVRAQLSNLGTGDHTVTGTEPFGISVYGYGQFTSFWYPGGLNLSEIVVE